MEILKTIRLKKYFPLSKSFLGKGSYVRAVDGVDISIGKGEVFGLVGESGCGKTTLGRLIVRLEEPTEGRIIFEGREVTKLTGKEIKWFRRKVQMIFQNPYTSFDPRYTIFDSVAEPLKIHKLSSSREELEELVIKALEEVGLVPAQDMLKRYPHELSGGQLQRASIARALLLKPDFLVADEPTSMLDASLRAGILNLLKRLNEERGMSVVLITHDIAAARYITKRMAVMYLGKMVEIGGTLKIIKNPLHPYTRALMASVLSPDPTGPMEEVAIKGEPRPVLEPKGCRFHPRCPYAMDRCRSEEPPLAEVEAGHRVACWLYAKG